MPATVTLSSTTLDSGVTPSQRSVRVASTSGLIPGLALFCDGELMSVVSLGIDPEINVIRGIGGTRATDHDGGATVYIGRPDQFFAYDPSGRPPAAIPVTPHINVLNGSVWFASGNPQGLRRWEKQEVSVQVGALGIRIPAVNVSTSD